jgi:hypothetical protein
MPFSIRKQEGKYCVINDDTKAVKKCYPSKAPAVDYMKALYANVPEAGKKDFDGWIYEYQISQSQANYNPVGGDGAKACANCQYFDSPNGCLVVSGDISPTGVSALWREKEVYTPEPMSVEVTNWPEQGAAGDPPNLAEIAKKWWDNLWGGKPTTEIEEGIKGLRPVYLSKDSDGRMRAHLVVSNNFEDRHDQVIPEVIHQRAIDFLERTNLHPEFQVWHMGTKSRWGEADLVTRTGNFTVFHGPVDPGKEALAEAFAKDRNTGVSNGYYATYTPDRKEFVAWYPYEASVLPLSHTANVWSCNPEVLESEGYLVKAEHKALLIGKGVPETFLDEMEKDILAQGQRVTAGGVGSKAVEGEPASTPAPANLGLDANTTMIINAVGTALGSAMKPVYERLDAIEQGQKSIQQQQTKTQDELVAEQILSRVGAGQGFKATETPGNIIDVNAMPDGQATSRHQEWLGEEIDKVLAANGVAIPQQGGN